MVVDIILVITGIVILVASVIFAGNSKDTSGDDSFFTKENLESKQNMVDEMIKASIDRLTDAAVVETDDALSRISDEKIMAINEFSETNIEKIKENHDHVVFLYNMLNSKDEEIKQTLADMENSKQTMKDTISEIIRITRQLNNAVKKNTKMVVGDDEELQKSLQNIKKPVPKAPQKEAREKADPRQSATIMADEASGQMNLPEMMQSDNKNEEILKLHKAGKSILDISKALKLGQGEVKLVIDLYGA